MKLKELREAAQPEGFEQYVERLRSQGVQQIGNGINSFVFQHPTMNNVAVKVFLDDDLGYREYIEFCIKHPQNKYSTKVLDTEDFADERRSKYVSAELHSNWNNARSDDPPYSIVFLEKLSKVDNDAFDSFVYRLGHMAGIEDINGLPKLGVNGWTKIAEQDEDKDLKEIAIFFLEQMKQGHKLDVGNRKNFMMRGEQIVFVDPFF